LIDPAASVRDFRVNDLDFKLIARINQSAFAGISMAADSRSNAVVAVKSISTPSEG
jgi:hypothetical protein